MYVLLVKNATPIDRFVELDQWLRQNVDGTYMYDQHYTRLYLSRRDDAVAAILAFGDCLHRKEKQ